MIREPYEYRLFVLERLDGSVWVPVEAASFSWSSDYTVNDNSAGLPPSPIGTLILGSETGSVSLSRWDTEGDVLYVGDTVRATYNGHVVFLGTVENVAVTATVDAEADKHGAKRRINIEASCGGFYADALSRTVTWTSLPEQPWINRIRLPMFGLTIVGW